jgi:hypothetical protein
MEELICVWGLELGKRYWGGRGREVFIRVNLDQCHGHVHGQVICGLNAGVYYGHVENLSHPCLSVFNPHFLSMQKTYYFRG